MQGRNTKPQDVRRCLWATACPLPAHPEETAFRMQRATRPKTGRRDVSSAQVPPRYTAHYTQLLTHNVLFHCAWVATVEKSDVGGLGHTGSTVYVPIVYASVWEAGSTLGRLHGVAFHRSGQVCGISYFQISGCHMATASNLTLKLPQARTKRYAHVHTRCALPSECTPTCATNSNCTISSTLGNSQRA